MQQIRYIVGAGFSAPLGLPTRATFLERAKDMIFRQPERYDRHLSLIREFDQVAKVGVYCATDPLDFEEVLAIIEMEAFAKARRTKKPFVDLIQDTIEYHSRALEKIAGPTGDDWVINPFGPHRRINLYGVFVAALLGVSLRRTTTPGSSTGGTDATRDYRAEMVSSRAGYAVLTTNYDLVFESFAEALQSHYRLDTVGQLTRPVIDGNKDTELPGLPLVKLHGSVDSDILLPPTWARSTHRKAAQIWEQGLARLSEANHLRIIGHSLATADSHLRYLIKAAVLAAPHLKSIDVVCLDPDGSVKRRYNAFFPFRSFRFVNADSVSYLKFISEWFARREPNPEFLSTALLEEAHEEFMLRAIAASKA